MILDIILIIIGLAILVLSSNMLIEAVVKLAEKLHISKLIVSLTIVALGTSVPETVVSIMASLTGSSIAFSNIAGSNIINVCLVFGIALVAGNVVIHKNMKMEIEKMTAVTGLFIILSLIGMGIGKIDGIIMLLLLTVYILSLFIMSKKDKELEDSDEAEEWIYNLGLKIMKKDWIVITVFITIGCLGLFLGGDLVVDMATSIAIKLNVNEGIIGATIVAIGTALPELVTTIAAIRKKQFDIIIGNVVGSNIINILLVLGISGIVGKVTIGGFEIEQLVLLGLSTALMYYVTIHKKKIGRKEGIAFLVFYIATFILTING